MTVRKALEARRFAGLAFAGLLLGGVMLSGCKRGGGDAAATDGKATPVVAQATSVTTASIRRIAEITDTALVTGQLTSEQDVTVGAKLAGRVRDVNFREGDRVVAGQVLVQQDPADLQAQLAAQEANLRAAQTRLAQAQLAYQDAKTNVRLTDQQTASAVKQAQAGVNSAKESAAVVKQGARTQERQQAQEAVSVAQADLASAKADQTKAREDLKRYRSLFTQQAVAQQQLDQAQAVADAADARVNSSVARVNSAQQQFDLIKEGNRPEDIRRAQAGVDQAQQTLVQAQANRSQLTLRQADVQNTLAGIGSAKAGVDQAQAAVNLARQALNDAAIVSPISGIVAERKIEPGAQVGAGKDVMRVVSLSDIFFDAQLPESQFAEVGVGQPVIVTVDALPNHAPFRGYVKKIFPVASSGARSFTVRIHLDNEANALRPQMFARGTITLATHRNALVVPRPTLLDYDGKTGRVFLAQNGVAAEKKVQTGFATAQLVEITGGLSEGDTVITVGQGQVQNGDKVQTQAGGNPPKEASADPKTGG